MAVPVLFHGELARQRRRGTCELAVSAGGGADERHPGAEAQATGVRGRRQAARLSDVRRRAAFKASAVLLQPGSGSDWQGTDLLHACIVKASSIQAPQVTMSHAQATETDLSQTPGVALSSTASAAQPIGALIDSDDPAWKHCSCPDVSRKHSLKCNYCQNIYTGGITRIKKHLAKIPKSGVAKCTKVPSDVKNEMFQLLRKKSDGKQKRAKELERDRAEIMDLSHSEGEGSDYDGHYAVAVLKAVRRLSTSKSGPMDKFCKPTPGEFRTARKGKGLSEKVQSKIAAQKREEERDRVCEYICQFFYEAGIPHNAVKLPSFALMLEAIGDYGPNLRGPSPDEISAFLQKMKKKGVSGTQQLRKRKKFIPDPDDEELSGYSSSDTEDSDIDMQSPSASSSSD